MAGWPLIITQQRSTLTIHLIPTAACRGWRRICMASCRAAKREGSVVEAREEEGDGGAEMIAPSLKRFCSSVVRKIAVEGNIATGKSTFLRILNESNSSYHVISEPLSKWMSVGTEEEETTPSQQCGDNLLDMFYKEPTRWAYTFQAYACLSRLKAQLGPPPAHLSGLTNSTIFYERSVYSDKLVFARNCHESGLMNELEWKVYCDWHSFLLPALPLTFNGFIYLRTNPQVCMERLHKRGRPEEKTVSMDYIKSLHQKHEDWLMERSVEVPCGSSLPPVLVLNCDSEFETDQERAAEHLKKVADFISSLPSPTP